MKKTMALAVVLLGSAALSSVLAQGTVRWGNSFSGTPGFRAQIYGVDPLDVMRRQSGNSSIGIPAGTTVYGGALLEGTRYTSALFFDNDQSPIGVNTTGFRTGAGAGVINGLLTVADPTRPPGTTPMAQIRVWDNQGGTVTSWQMAMARQDTPFGSSDPFQLAGLGGTAGGTLFQVPDTTGVRSFNIALPVPEPSLIALGALGLGALLLRRRK